MSAPDVFVRPVTLDDAGPLAALISRTRVALAPWEPVREDAYFTEAGQRSVLAEVLERQARHETYPAVITADDRLVGRVNLNNIVGGPFASTDLGYWVDPDYWGRGIATAAVGQVLGVAFSGLGLHRVQAGTLLTNTASRRVLARHRFTEIGVAPRYLHIAGEWQDHLLHQRLADDPPTLAG